MLLAGGLALASAVSLWAQNAEVAVLGAQVLAALSLVYRRSAPFVPPVVVLVASGSMLAASQNNPDDIVYLIIWIVGSYGAGAYLPWPQTLLALGIWWTGLLLTEGAGLEWGDVLFFGLL